MVNKIRKTDWERVETASLYLLLKDYLSVKVEEGAEDHRIVGAIIAPFSYETPRGMVHPYLGWKRVSELPGMDGRRLPFGDLPTLVANLKELSRNDGAIVVEGNEIMANAAMIDLSGIDQVINSMGHDYPGFLRYYALDDLDKLPEIPMKLRIGDDEVTTCEEGFPGARTGSALASAVIYGGPVYVLRQTTSEGGGRLVAFGKNGTEKRYRFRRSEGMNEEYYLPRENDCGPEAAHGRVLVCEEFGFRPDVGANITKDYPVKWREVISEIEGSLPAIYRPADPR
jgi:hypothetical protein